LKPEAAQAVKEDGDVCGWPAALPTNQCWPGARIVFYFAPRIILRAQKWTLTIIDSLFAAVSSNSVGSFDDGNKSRIISNRDQKKGQIPSKIMLRLIAHR
jgi:hypothetical protein